MSEDRRPCLLLVEDEALVAMLIEDMLHEQGCSIAGPASSIEQALRLVSEETLDGAILDVNLHGKSIEPVADALAAKGVPFVFVTGYGAATSVGRHGAAPKLQKPFQPQALEQAIRRMLKPAGNGAGR